MSDFLSDFIFEAIRFVLMGGLMVLGAFIGISLRKRSDKKKEQQSVIQDAAVQTDKN